MYSKKIREISKKRGSEAILIRKPISRYSDIVDFLGLCGLKTRILVVQDDDQNGPRPAFLAFDGLEIDREDIEFLEKVACSGKWSGQRRSFKATIVIRTLQQKLGFSALFNNRVNELCLIKILEERTAELLWE